MTEPSEEAKAWVEKWAPKQADWVNHELSAEAFDAGRKFERERLLKDLTAWAESKEPNESAE